MPLFSPTSILRWSISGGLLALAGCVDPYMPSVLDTSANHLVVDGFINGNGRTRIKLSRTAAIASSTTPPAEKGATLFIVDDAGTRYSLTEISDGYYRSDSMQLVPTRQYQLRITTSTQVAYASDLVPLKVTPPIDKVTWQLNGSQVQLLLSTHDAQQQSRYYRWGLVETWEFSSAFYSKLAYDPVQKIIVDRLSPINTCWRTERPSTIKQGSSAQLSLDALTDAPLTTLDGHDERFKVRYSLLVSQYAETAAEFNYYELLRKNTESVGSVNDPLPTQLTGNVHRTDSPTEPVLGYVGAHTVQQKRIFINNQDLNLPQGWVFNTPYDLCTSTIEMVPDKSRYPIYIPQTYVFASPSNTPIDYYFVNGMQAGYVGSTTDCVDCRTRGSITKPSFW